MRASGDGDGDGDGEGDGDARDGVVVVVLATSRDRDEAHLDGLAADAHASEAEADEGDGDDDGRGARAGGDDEEERRERRRARWATRRRIFVATRKRERVRESANIGGLLTRATLNALERKTGQTSASWGQFLRSKQRSMQRLPPGTSSSIRLSSNRCVAIETERMTFAKPARNVGRRRGVFVGVNYEECGREEWRLRRRGSDAIRMRDYLKTHCGYDEDDELMVLVEDAEARATDGSVNRVCSKRAILKACRWLSQGAKEGDSLFFYFSGRQDVVGDESDTNFKGSEKTALCASDTPGDATQRISRRELREALVEGLPPNAYLTVFLDIFGGGGENALDKLPYSCVDVHLPDEKEIKNSKSGKGTTTVAPLRMVPRGEKMVKDFLELTKSVSRLHAESTKAMNDFYDKQSARAAATEAQKRRDAEIEEREKRKAEEERQKRESVEEEERRRRVEREEAERRRIEEEERQKRESVEEEERRRRVEREEAERRRIEEEDAASRRERDSTQTRRDEGASQVETGLEGDDGSGMSESLAEKKRQAVEFARKEAKEADRTRLQTYEFIETTPSEVQLTKKGQPSCCTIA
jgi:hypothetical protein